MKRFVILIAVCLLFAGCTSDGSIDISDVDLDEAKEAVEQEINENLDEIEQSAGIAVPEDMLSTINDWILGTEYGIENIDFDGSTFTISMPEDKRAQLADYELSDINEGLINLGKAFEYENCSVVFADGSNVADGGVADTDNNSDTHENTSVQSNNIPSDGETINLIFIHHSVGENWLNDGLNQMLNDNNIHVADTYYGWSDMGDSTDTTDWPRWFNDDVMPSVYNKMDTETAYNSIEPGEGENTIIMFKSCFPNSDVGNSIDDEIAIYDSLLDYFAQHPNKMFVLVTPPPMQNISNPEKTRELTNYLVRRSGWLKDYTEHNVLVFDLYNVLTHPDNHHMLVDNSVKHTIVGNHNTLYYDSGGDDHPNGEGNVKAAEEFVPLLMYWYDIFAN